MNIKFITMAAILLSGCTLAESPRDANKEDAKNANAQQRQYSDSQPVPFFDYSLERDLVMQLYNMRNLRAVTHSVWRSDLGTVEGDCPSIGFGIPYDTSLTNPLVSEWGYNGASNAVEQSEPNGIFASKNTAATWVMCAGEGGVIEPVYVETKVTTYPYAVSVNYETNRVKKSGSTSVTISTR